MTIEKRIEALEKRCKRLGKILVGVGTLALFAVVAGTAGWTVAYTGAISPSKIVTETIHLKDHNGKVRVRLTGADGTIAVYDSAGKTRVRLDGSNGILSVNDSAGKTKVRLEARWEYGSVRAYDKAERTRVRLLGFDGSVRAYDKAGRARVRLLGSTGNVSFTDSDGTTISHPWEQEDEAAEAVHNRMNR
jgi:hypothetical protein